MSTTPINDEMRLLSQTLKEMFGDNFLGSREDRDELSFWVMPSVWRQAGEFLKSEGYNHLSDLTAVDYLDRDPRYDVMAILASHDSCTYLRLKTVVEEDQAVDSFIPLWTGANWFEREIFDLFGIEFNDHPDQKRILLPADYTGHPLRKDYPITGPAGSAFR